MAHDEVREEEGRQKIIEIMEQYYYYSPMKPQNRGASMHIWHSEVVQKNEL